MPTASAQPDTRQLKNIVKLGIQLAHIRTVKGKEV